MFWKRKYPGIAVTLAVSFIFFMSGGISQAAEENLIADEPFKVIQPEKAEIIDPNSLKIEISKFELTKIGPLESLTVSKPKTLKPGTFSKGTYTPTQRENPAYDRCAKYKEFNALLACALQAINNRPEE